MSAKGVGSQFSELYSVRSRSKYRKMTEQTSETNWTATQNLRAFSFCFCNYVAFKVGNLKNTSLAHKLVRVRMITSQVGIPVRRQKKSATEKANFETDENDRENDNVLYGLSALTARTG